MLDFKHFMAKVYLQGPSASQPKASGHPNNKNKKILSEIKYNTIGHNTERTDDGKQRKCGFIRKCQKAMHETQGWTAHCRV